MLRISSRGGQITVAQGNHYLVLGTEDAQALARALPKLLRYTGKLEEQRTDLPLRLLLQPWLKATPLRH